MTLPCPFGKVVAFEAARIGPSKAGPVEYALVIGSVVEPVLIPGHVVMALVLLMIHWHVGMALVLLVILWPVGMALVVVVILGSVGMALAVVVIL
jgi:hypothetical protein